MEEPPETLDREFILTLFRKEIRGCIDDDTINRIKYAYLFLNDKDTFVEGLDDEIFKFSNKNYKLYITFERNSFCIIKLIDPETGFAICLPLTHKISELFGDCAKKIIDQKIEKDKIIFDAKIESKVNAEK